MVDPRAVAAAANNADLYEIMFGAHGLRFERSAYAFVGLDRPQPYYSNLTVLRPEHRQEVVERLRDIAMVNEGVVGFKDGFAEFDFTDYGFRILHEAEWLWISPPPAGLPAGWTCITGARDLQRWEEAWKSQGSPTEVRMFPEALLSVAEVAFFAKIEQGRVVAGCLGKQSADCVGLSNIFGMGNPTRIVVEAATAISTMAPHLPLTSYAAGSFLTAAEQAGFKSIGKLRVQVADAAQL